METVDTAQAYGQGPKERYQAFVATAARTGTVWGVWVLESWMVRADPADEARTLFLLWPTEADVRRSMRDHPDQFAQGAVPEAIPLEKWLARYTPGLMERDARPCVFPDRDFAGVTVAASELAGDIERSLRGEGGLMLQARDLNRLHNKLRRKISPDS